ncbi:MAG: alpha/beta hydrolase-fold protein [Nonlabens sp.]
MRTYIFIIGVCLLVSCNDRKNDNKEERQITPSTYVTDSIYSTALGENRKHNIYLPENFNPNHDYPILYCTDGSTLKANGFLKKGLDSLISNKIIVPIIVVESHSNTAIADSTSMTRGDGTLIKLNYRNFEYVKQPTTDSLLAQRYDQHRTYFSRELIQHIEQELNQESNPKDRYFYGYSNGAGFGMGLISYEPKLMETYLCYSTFGGTLTIQDSTITRLPDLYFKYGSEEPFFLAENAKLLRETYSQYNSFIEIEEYVGGHDYKIWRNELFENLVVLFQI